MKKSLKKKVISIICTAAICFGLLPMQLMQTVFAQSSQSLVPQFLMEAFASSAEIYSDSNAASNAIDGNVGSLWHTSWSEYSPAPHYIAVDLGRPLEVSKITYLPRQDSSTNGTYTQYRVYGSLDGETYTQLDSGIWANNSLEKEASFSPVMARYIKLESVRDYYGSCAELNVYAQPGVLEPLWENIALAVQYANNAEIGELVNQYSQEVYDDFIHALNTAKLSANDETVNDSPSVQAVINTLDEAVNAFISNKNKYTEAELEQLLEQANTLKDATSVGSENGQVPAEAKDAFEAVIQDADAVLKDSASTPMEIHEAFEALEAAMAEFQDCIYTNEKSLAGTWELKLGAYDADDETLPDTCILPGTLDENNKGFINSSINNNKLNRKRTYTGNAVYQKQVYIPENWNDKNITFSMERTKITTVWVNGVLQTDYNSNDTLGTTQTYVLSGIIPGEKNTITVQVSNTNYPEGTSGGHMITEETVTNWNGIIGDITLKATDLVYIKRVKVFPDIHTKTAAAKITVVNKAGGSISGGLTMEAESYNHDGITHTPGSITHSFSMNAGETEKEMELTYNIGEGMKLWSEFEPALYAMTVSLNVQDSYADSYDLTFGMREFNTDGNKFTINGTTTFMRGEGNSAVFPLTGYPFMTKEEWIDFFSTSQELGINFFRYHSWTPPKVAFDAADELGIYMQPELYGFGGNYLRTDYFKEEGLRILDYLANSPSFVMFAWGNELDTTSAAKRNAANDLRELCKAADDTRLYAEGSNNNYWNPSLNTGDDYWTTCKTKANSDPHHIRISFSWADAASGGTIESLQPNTTHNYNGALAGYEHIPVMNHEAGQYQVLPYFDAEIPKYEEGIFEARNLQSFRDLMESKGLLHMNETFSRVSARLSAIGYRADMETALRSSSLAGYQLLSIQDFPGQGTAHVGILDNFMDDKLGGFTKKQYKNFNDAIVVLGQFEKLLYKNNESLTGTVTVVNYGESALDGVAGKWALKDGDTVLDSGTLAPAGVGQGIVTDIGTFTVSLADVTEAKKLTVEVGVDSIGNTNSYDIWVYPNDLDTITPAGVTVTNNMNEETLEALASGQKVLYLPEPSKKVLNYSTAVRWTTDYWSKMFHGSSENAHTMGMYVNEEHPIFRDFPTEFFSDYQWFNLMKGSRALVLDEAPSAIEPLAWNIDHMEWSRKLGSLFEVKVGAGNLIVCSFDLLNQMDTYPEAKQLYYSILQCMETDEFDPQVEITANDLTDMFNESYDGFKAYNRIQGEDYSSNYGNHNTESGTEEGSDDPQTAVGGLRDKDWLKYDRVDFGNNGANKIIINGSNANASAAGIEVRLGSNTGELLETVYFTNTGSSWSLYKSQVFDIPRVSGVQDIVLVFLNGSIAFNYFQFIETEIQFVDPYSQMEPESAAGDIEITNINGGSHVIMQNYVSQITDQVEIKFNNIDFGFNGSYQVVIQGRALSDADVSASIRYVDQSGMEQSIPFVFKPGEGERYELSSEEFYRQTFLAKGIKGEQDFIIAFDEGTRFDFESLYFIEYNDPKPAYYEVLAKGTAIYDEISLRPLLYTEESWNAFDAAYLIAVAIDINDDAAVLSATEALEEAIDGLVLSGKTKSAYTTTYARNYDQVLVGSVNLERQAPNQVVGGFDEGEKLLYKGLDFGANGASKLTVCAANGRSDNEQKPIATLRFRYGTGANDYENVTILQTGGWGAANDQEFEFSLDPAVFTGTKDITVELVEGALAFNYFIFEEAEATGEPAYKKFLEAAIKYAEKQELDENLNKLVVAEFNAALEHAKTVYANEAATQDEVDAATERLLSAIHKLDFIADSSDLEELVTLAEKIELDLYYDGPVKDAFIDALQNAKDVLNDPTSLNEEFDEAYNRLLSALEALAGELIPPVDTTQLEKMIARGDKTVSEKDKYLDTGWTAFEEALANAKAVLENSKDQEEIDVATMALYESMFDLRLKPNKDLLARLLNQGYKVNARLYTVETIAVLDKALEGAQDVYDNPQATQAEVTKATKDVQSALNGLIRTDAAGASNTGGNTDDDADTKGSSSTGNTGAKSSSTTATSIPKTGDESPLGFLIALAVIGGLGLFLGKNKNR